MSTPRIAKCSVYPVAGRDSMELNLSGAHAPYFTRNVLVLEDTHGNLGLGEVPGGESITATLRACEAFVLGAGLATYREIVNRIRSEFADRDAAGRGLQTFDRRTTIHAVTAVESVPGLDAVFVGPSDLGQSIGVPPRMDTTEPKTVEAIDLVLERARHHDVVAGIFTVDPEYAAAMIDKGFRFVSVASDARLAASAADAVLGRLRAEVPR